MAGLKLSRQPGQSWRDAAIAQARRFGLQDEVAAACDDFVANGTDEAWAAFDACSEWDVLDLVDDRPATPQEETT